MTVLSVALFALLGTFTTGYHVITRASTKGAASVVADSAMERFRGMAYDDITCPVAAPPITCSSGSTTRVGPDGRTYTVTTVVSTATATNTDYGACNAPTWTPPCPRTVKVVLVIGRRLERPPVGEPAVDVRPADGSAGKLLTTGARSADLWSEVRRRACRRIRCEHRRTRSHAHQAPVDEPVDRRTVGRLPVPPRTDRHPQPPVGARGQVNGLGSGSGKRERERARFCIPRRRHAHREPAGRPAGRGVLGRSRRCCRQTEGGSPSE